MNCVKCGKIINRDSYNIQNVNTLKCSKCIFLCSITDCKKKIFKSGHCSTHVLIVNDKKEKFKGLNLTDEDFKRREDKLHEFNLKCKSLEYKRTLICLYREKIVTEHIPNSWYTLGKMMKNFQESINEYKETFSDNACMKNKQNKCSVESNLDKISNKDDVLCFETIKNKSRVKPKEFKHYFDNYRLNKYEHEKCKAERTLKRKKERKNRNFEEISINQEQETYDLDNEEINQQVKSKNILMKLFESLEIVFTDEKDKTRMIYKKDNTD